MIQSFIIWILGEEIAMAVGLALCIAGALFGLKVLLEYDDNSGRRS